MKRFLQRFYLALIFILLYAPILTLIVLSFNKAKTRARWGGFTLHWYSVLFQNEAIMKALYTTLIIAILAALISTVLGTLAALGISKMTRRLKNVTLGLTNIPMLNGEIVMGISLMLLFIAFKVSLGFGTVLLAHITFCVPYVVLSVMPKIRQTSRYAFEAALDLGASPARAFFSVTFPDLWPGIVSGFLLSFTMSIDDFVITYFTKGPGIDTLSTKIYSEVRKGIKPEMYSLSTILFGTALLLLLLVNMNPEPKMQKVATSVRRRRHPVRFFFRRILPVSIGVIIVAGGFYYSSKNTFTGNDQVIVYNWGEYIDPEVIKDFEEETHIDVIYEEFETNEIMFPKIKSGAISYDVVVPSDYMVQRMIEEDLLSPLNFDHIPNVKNIGQIYMDTSRQFDPKNAYSIPYCWGTVGILYNTKLVHENIDSWNVLWDPKYRDSILMQDSVRDAFAVSLKRLGYSLNAKDLDELFAAKNALIEQKPLVQAYVIDQVRDKMIGGEAALGVIYSGEALTCCTENPDLRYVVPKEGSNVWIDSLVIPKNAKNKENAEKFINFLCRPDIAAKNYAYIRYSTPNIPARDLIKDDALKNSPIAFPDDAVLARCETFSYLGERFNRIYNKLWREVKSK